MSNRRYDCVVDWRAASLACFSWRIVVKVDGIGHGLAIADDLSIGLQSFRGAALL